MAFFLGIVGAHLFYYRKYIRAVVYVLLSWTFVPILLGWIDMIFVGKWTREINNHSNVEGPRKKQVSKNVQKDLASKNIIDEKLKGSNKKTESSQNVQDKSNETKTLKVEVNKKLQGYRLEMEKKLKEKQAEEEIRNDGTKPVVTEGNTTGAAAKKVSSFFKDSFTFYSEQDIILPKYSHLKITADIKKSIEEAKKPNSKVYDREGYSFEVSISGSHYSFIRDSLKYAQTRGYESKEIPFESYWPTFDNLDKRQLKWYFYWREQTLKGNYMDVDLSYIFIFVYELLNYTFTQNAALNVSMLERLNENYRERQPKLPKYLDMWIADMLYELGEKELALQMVEEEQYIPKLYNFLQDQSDSLGSISITYWKPYISNYRETTFFSSHKNKVYKKFKQSIPLLQVAYQEEGKNLLDEWFGKRKQRQVRHLYRSAVMGRKYDDTHVYIDVVYEKDALADVVTNLFRLAENVVRLETGEKRQIKVAYEMLPNDMKEKMINARFKTVQKKDEGIKGSKIPEPTKEEKQVEPDKEVEKKDLVFDWEEINQKDKELTDIKNKIEAKENGEVESKRKTDMEEHTGNNKSEEEDNVQEPSLKQTVPKSLTNILSDGEEDFVEFAQSLNKNQREFLSLFEEGELPKEKAKDFAKQNGTMFGVFLSELNELAMEHIEDTLLEEVDDKIAVIKDYEEVIDLVRGVSVEN